MSAYRNIYFVLHDSNGYAYNAIIPFNIFKGLKNRHIIVNVNNTDNGKVMLKYLSNTSVELYVGNNTGLSPTTAFGIFGLN